jgi:hypothetical protein
MELRLELCCYETRTSGIVLDHYRIHSAADKTHSRPQLGPTCATRRRATGNLEGGFTLRLIQRRDTRVFSDCLRSRRTFWPPMWWMMTRSRGI